MGGSSKEGIKHQRVLSPGLLVMMMMYLFGHLVIGKSNLY